MADAAVKHGGVRCDGCGAMPIEGARFKCLQCRDADLCETCVAGAAGNAGHAGGTHAWVRLAKPLGPQTLGKWPLHSGTIYSGDDSGDAAAAAAADTSGPAPEPVNAVTGQIPNLAR